MQPIRPQSAQSEERLLTLQEAADRLGVSLGTMRSIRAMGRLPVVRTSMRTIRIHPADLRRYVEESREGRRPFGRARA